ncbi:MAG: adenylyl-sulfate kinase, partial [Chloroflexi bacterium]
VKTMFLDGDNLRHGLNGDLGFSSADRQENIRRAGEIAKLSYAHGNVTLACFISPFTADRRFARGLVGNGRFIEIYVKCDLEVVKRRDTKGLYAKALAGELDNFTGISSPYEEPVNAEIVVETDIQSVDEIVDKIINELQIRGILPTT